MRYLNTYQFSESTAYDFFAIVLLLIFLQFSFVESVFAQDRPIVYVSFEFEGDDFTDELSDADLNSISENMTEQFILTAREKHGFLNWVNADPPNCSLVVVSQTNCESTTVNAENCDSENDAPQECKPAWTIKLKLEYHKKRIRGRDRTSISADLIHEGRFPSGITDILHRSPIYREGGNIPFSDPGQLEYDISINLEEEIETILGTTKAMKFVGDIPIAKQVITDGTKEFVIIPVKFQDLNADPESVLFFEFTEPGGQGADMIFNPREIKKPTNDDTESDEEVVYEYTGLVRVWVEKVRQNTEDLSGFSGGSWHSAFETVIRDAKDKRVYVRTWFPDSPGTGDGSVAVIE